MLTREAHWLAERLGTWPTHRGAVVNVGASSADFRERVQPWIDALVLRPAQAGGLRFVHQDLQPAPGVDVVGDLCDPACRARLQTQPLVGALCSSVLEHVPDRPAFAEALTALLPPGGRLLVTVPRRFPLHPDPIDTGYRPRVAEVEALFRGWKTLAAAELRCGRLQDLVLASVPRLLARSGAPGGGGPPKRLADWLPYAVRSFRVTCVELERR